MQVLNLLSSLLRSQSGFTKGVFPIRTCTRHQWSWCLCCPGLTCRTSPSQFSFWHWTVLSWVCRLWSQAGSSRNQGSRTVSLSAPWTRRFLTAQGIGCTVPRHCDPHPETGDKISNHIIRGQCTFHIILPFMRIKKSVAKFVN